MRLRCLSSDGLVSGQTNRGGSTANGRRTAPAAMNPSQTTSQSLSASSVTTHAKAPTTATAIVARINKSDVLLTNRPMMPAVGQSRPRGVASTERCRPGRPRVRHEAIHIQPLAQLTTGTEAERYVVLPQLPARLGDGAVQDFKQSLHAGNLNRAVLVQVLGRPWRGHDLSRDLLRPRLSEPRAPERRSQLCVGFHANRSTRSGSPIRLRAYRPRGLRRTIQAGTRGGDYCSPSCRRR